MRVKHKPAYCRVAGRLVAHNPRNRISVLTLEADLGEEEWLLAWLRRAVTGDLSELLKLAVPDQLYEPPAAPDVRMAETAAASAAYEESDRER